VSWIIFVLEFQFKPKGNLRYLNYREKGYAIRIVSKEKKIGMSSDLAYLFTQKLSFKQFYQIFRDFIIPWRVVAPDPLYTGDPVVNC